MKEVVVEHVKDLFSSLFYYSYDNFNNMTKASPAGAQALEYKYYGYGLRVKRIINGKVIRKL